MGITRSKSLKNAAFCVVSKMFALRGGIEHWSLKLSQVKRMRIQTTIMSTNIYQRIGMVPSNKYRSKGKLSQ